MKYRLVVVMSLIASMSTIGAASENVRELINIHPLSLQEPQSVIALPGEYKHDFPQHITKSQMATLLAGVTPSASGAAPNDYVIVSGNVHMYAITAPDLQGLVERAEKSGRFSAAAAAVKSKLWKKKEATDSDPIVADLDESTIRVGKLAAGMGTFYAVYMADYKYRAKHGAPFSFTTFYSSNSGDDWSQPLLNALPKWTSSEILRNEGANPESRLHQLPAGVRDLVIDPYLNPKNRPNLPPPGQ